MNYFAGLLLAAGLPVGGWMSSAAPAAVQPPPRVPSIDWAQNLPASSIASVSQSYRTMLAYQQSASRKAATSGGKTTSTPQPPSPVTASNPKSVGGSLSAPAAEMIQLINAARVKAGLAPYAINAELMTLARERAAALASGPFTSDMAGYGWPVQMEQAAGIHAQDLGAENIAEAANVSQAFAMLMASPPHRENILSPYATQIGVGVAPRGSGIAISELFIGPSL